MLRNINSEHILNLSRMEKFALIITNKIGTLGFFILIVFWTMSWMGWNILAPSELRFDPFPTFLTWLFISNLIQIFLMPLIMIGQNVQAKHAQLRANRHYESDIKADERMNIITKMFITQEKTYKEIHELVSELHKNNNEKNKFE